MIITYGWCRVAYAVLRCLSEHGVKVIVGGPEGGMMAGRSKYAFASFTYPSPYTDPIGFVDAVAEAARRYDAGVYIPIHEEIMPVAQYRDRLPDELKIPISSYGAILKAYDKGTTMAHAISVDVPIPETYHPFGVDDLETISKNIEYPSLIKLRKSNSAKGVFKVTSPNDLVSRYKEAIETFNVADDSLPIIQKYVPGNVYAVSMLFNHGKMRAKFTRKNIREKTYGGGTCTKCVSVRNEILENYAEKMLSSLDWHGVAMMEFKYDERRGKGYLLEINPRYHGTINHDVESGMPIPYLHYLMALNGDVEPHYDYQLGLKSRWILGDVIGLVDHLPKTKNKLRFIRDFLTFDEDNYMDLKKDDIKPFLIQILYYLKKFLKTGSRNPIDEGMLG